MVTRSRGNALAVVSAGQKASAFRSRSSSIAQSSAIRGKPKSFIKCALPANYKCNLELAVPNKWWPSDRAAAERLFLSITIKSRLKDFALWILHATHGRGLWVGVWWHEANNHRIEGACSADEADALRANGKHPYRRIQDTHQHCIEHIRFEIQGRSLSNEILSRKQNHQSFNFEAKQ